MEQKSEIRHWEGHLDIGLIAVPLIATKKKQDRIFPFASSLNYGLLSIATHLNSHGFSAKVFDPREWQEGFAVKRTLEWIKENQPKYVALSCISGFSYPAFKLIAKEIRKTFPTLPIITGGKDHLALIAEKAMEECPEIDVVVTGEGELALLEIMKRGLSRTDTESLTGLPNVLSRNKAKNLEISLSHSLFEPDELIPLDFTLHENFLAHPPCIEVGRGCPYGCYFCHNDRNEILKKSPEAIIEEAKVLSGLYGKRELLLYFQTPMFLMSNKDLSLLSDLRTAMGLSFEWRTQTRADYLKPEKIDLISKAGGRVIDLGLESGSPEMLMAMGKTENPSKYLSITSTTLHAAKKLRVKIKLNILFYAGERRKTLLETFYFLEDHTDLSWTISAYPLLIYPGTVLENSITPILKKHGGSVAQPAEWKDRHLTPVNPSKEFSYQEMQRIGTLFGKSFQTFDEYFDERRYGYYKPGTTYGEFLECINGIDLDDLPCSIDSEDMLRNRQVLKSILEDNNADCVDGR